MAEEKKFQSEIMAEEKKFQAEITAEEKKFQAEITAEEKKFQAESTAEEKKSQPEIERQERIIQAGGERKTEMEAADSNADKTLKKATSEEKSDGFTTGFLDLSVIISKFQDGELTIYPHGMPDGTCSSEIKAVAMSDGEGGVSPPHFVKCVGKYSGEIVVNGSEGKSAKFRVPNYTQDAAIQRMLLKGTMMIEEAETEAAEALGSKPLHVHHREKHFGTNSVGSGSGSNLLRYMDEMAAAAEREPAFIIPPRPPNMLEQLVLSPYLTCTCRKDFCAEPSCHFCLPGVCATLISEYPCKNDPWSKSSLMENYIICGNQNPKFWDQKCVQEWLLEFDFNEFASSIRKFKMEGKHFLQLDRQWVKKHGKWTNDYQIDVMMAYIASLREISENNWPVKGSIFSFDKVTYICGHRMADYIFPGKGKCADCDKFILRDTRTGIVCLDCGLVAHKKHDNQSSKFCQELLKNQDLEIQIKRQFGVDLVHLFYPEYEQTAPVTLLLLMEELEKKAKLWADVDIFAAYCDEPVHNKISCDFFYHLTKGRITALMLRYTNPAILATCIGKYLMELPNPLIPFEKYEAFIGASKINDGKMHKDRLQELISELPDHHRLLLQFTLAHIFHICKSQIDHGRVAFPAKFLRIFSQWIIRPSWDKITRHIYDTEAHYDILCDLLKYFNPKGDFPYQRPMQLDNEALMVDAPKKLDPSEIMLALANYISSETVLLSQKEWFWGNISKSAARSKLQNSIPGTFLVADFNKDGHYALVFKCLDAVKKIEIMRENDKYGITKPCTFDSLCDLIENYKNDSFPNVINADVMLGDALIKDEDKDPACFSFIWSKLKKWWAAIILSGFRRRGEISEFQYDEGGDVHVKSYVISTKADSIHIFERQVELHRDPSTFQFESHSLKERLQLLLSRGRENSKEFYANLEQRLKKLKEDLFPSVREEVVVLNWLLSHETSLDHIFEAIASDPVVVWNLQRYMLLPHHNENSWLSHSFGFRQAADFLQDKENGTFLIRCIPCGLEYYVLSVVYQGTVHHCLLHFSDGGYSFTVDHTDLKFGSLKALVLYYSQCSLSHHDPVLRTKLLYPAFQTLYYDPRLEILEREGPPCAPENHQPQQEEDFGVRMSIPHILHRHLNE